MKKGEISLINQVRRKIRVDFSDGKFKIKKKQKKKVAVRRRVMGKEEENKERHVGFDKISVEGKTV